MEETRTLPPPVTLRDVARILWRRAPIGLFTFVLVVGTAVFVTSRMAPVYEGHARVLLYGNNGTSLPTNIMDLMLSRGGNGMETEMEKIRSRSFLEEVMQRAGMKDVRPEDFVNNIRLSATTDQILDIIVRGGTAKEAQLRTNTVARVYMDHARAEYNQRVDLSQERLITAKDKAKQEKDEAETALNAFNNKLGISDPTRLFADRAAQTVGARSQLEDARRTLTLQQKSLGDLNEQIKHIPPEVMTGYTQVKNPIIDGYKTELYGLEAQRKTLLFDFAPDSMEVQALDKQIQAKKDAIHSAEQDLYSKSSLGIGRNPDYAKFQSSIFDTNFGIAQTKNNIAGLEHRLSFLEGEQKRLTTQQNTWEGLKRKRDMANDIYEQARSGLIKMETSRQMSEPMMNLLDEAALPREPVSPKPLLNLIMAITLGLFLGAGMSLLAEYMAAGRLAHGEDGFDPDLPHVGGVPLLGTVPIALPAPAELSGPHAVPFQANLASADVLREIGFTLAHRRPGDPVPVVVFSGTRTDDTAAAIAAQLAATLVRDGLRITLVDADRARPRLNRVFGKPDAPGLADVLSGRNNLKDALYRGAGGDLRFLAAGAPDDPTPMTEKGLRAVFRQLAAETDTDMVVVSAPSVWQALHVGPLERAASGLVLVASDATSRTGGTPPEESVARARRILSNGHQPRLLGVVLGQDPAAHPGRDNLSLPPVPASEVHEEGEHIKA